MRKLILILLAAVVFASCPAFFAPAKTADDA